MTLTTAVTQGLALPLRQGSAEVCLHSILHAVQTKLHTEMRAPAPCTQRFFAIQHRRGTPSPNSALISQLQSS
jgi:hypothetical protein